MSYELIAGERRFRAARRAGLQSIPALVHQADDAMSLEEALVENLHREDLNPLDEAGAYQQLIEEFNLTHEEVARKVGRSRAGVTNALRLFQLPPTVQRYVRDGQLSAGHARTLLGTPDRILQERLAGEAVHRGLSVRSLEELVRGELREAQAEEGGLGGTVDETGQPDQHPPDDSALPGIARTEAGALTAAARGARSRGASGGPAEHAGQGGHGRETRQTRDRVRHIGRPRTDLPGNRRERPLPEVDGCSLRGDGYIGVIPRV